jgi:hypothetical protein
MGTHYTAIQNNGLPLQTNPYKQKHMTSDHIHDEQNFQTNQ